MASATRRAGLAIACFLLQLASGPAPYVPARSTYPSPRRRADMRSTTGSSTAIYVEDLVQGRWVGRYWCAEGKPVDPSAFWSTDAFELGFKDQPTSPEVPATRLPGGWQWAGLARIPGGGAAASHVAVGLKHASRPIELRVHTRLDGTPVLVRWLEITNRSTRPLALFTAAPGAGASRPPVDRFLWAIRSGGTSPGKAGSAGPSSRTARTCSGKIGA